MAEGEATTAAPEAPARTAAVVAAITINDDLHIGHQGQGRGRGWQWGQNSGIYSTVFSQSLYGAAGRGYSSASGDPTSHGTMEQQSDEESCFVGWDNGDISKLDLAPMLGIPSVPSMSQQIEDMHIPGCDSDSVCD